MNKIKEARLKKKWTIAELSRRLKKQGTPISPSSLIKYERGERRPKIDKYQALAKVFNCPISYLLKQPKGVLYYIPSHFSKIPWEPEKEDKQ